MVAGPSGVGKSSLTNRLQPGADMEVGEVSRKIDRGRHTTRHTELIWIEEETYFLDTPGFSSLYLENLDWEELGRFFPEFEPYATVPVPGMYAYERAGLQSEGGAGERGDQPLQIRKLLSAGSGTEKQKALLR